jgi:hypothetical protein
MDQIAGATSSTYNYLLASGSNITAAMTSSVARIISFK